MRRVLTCDMAWPKVRTHSRIPPRKASSVVPSGLHLHPHLTSHLKPSHTAEPNEAPCPARCGCVDSPTTNVLLQSVQPPGSPRHACIARITHVRLARRGPKRTPAPSETKPSDGRFHSPPVILTLPQQRRSRLAGWPAVCSSLVRRVRRVRGHGLCGFF